MSSFMTPVRKMLMYNSKLTVAKKVLMIQSSLASTRLSIDAKIVVIVNDDKMILLPASQPDF